jgi:hypothetical protein
MNERMRFDPAKAAEDGKQDAHGLVAALCSLWDEEDEALSNDADGKQSAALLNDALAGIIGLAVENRIEECQARLAAFSRIIGPALYLAGEGLYQVTPATQITESEGGEL